MNIRLRDKRILRTVVIAAGVGAAAALVLTPKGREQTSLAIQKARPTIHELMPLVQVGAENVLHLAEDHRAELVDAVVLFLTNQTGAPNINDPVARLRAERLVDQGTGLLRAIVERTEVGSSQAEGQSAQPAANPT
ncbi:MAG: hypothetical protein KIT87_25350 [Anaerolineae bacterium]|nr:hypothetical protein [Anaerolineae bacterium]